METEDLIRLVKRIEAEEEGLEVEDNSLRLHTVRFPSSLYNPGFKRLRDLMWPKGA